MKSNILEKGPKEMGPKAEAWERFKKSQVWAAKAPVSLMMRLYNVSRLVKQQLEDRSNFSSSQLRILYEALEPTGVSQVTICKNYNIDPGSVTRTVHIMERDGLITRQPDAGDNRLMRVYITDKGRALIEGVPQRMAQFEQELVEGWTDAEVLQLHSLLQRIENRLSTNIADNPNKNLVSLEK